MNICVISPSFPTTKTVSFIFVEQICKEFVNLGHTITVISPQSITKVLLRKNTPLMPRHYKIITNNDSISVYRPYYISFGNRRITVKGFNNAVKNQLTRLKTKFDVIYGHFWESAYGGYYYSREHSIPLISVAGEDYITIQNLMKQKEIQDLYRYHSGCICVSSKSQQESINTGFTTKEKSIVIPNAINPSIFYKKNKNIIREKLGINKDDFIIAYVGQFTHRKGIYRLCKALNIIDNPHIKAFLIGTGPIKPSYNNTIVSGKVSHDELPDLLNAADIFVLPTLSEGCCNAIIEAMACGLPIVSTDALFNTDILDATNSILIDPMSIDDIKNAILQLYNNPNKREQLSNGSLQTAAKLTLPERAKKIIKYIEKIIEC